MINWKLLALLFLFLVLVFSMSYAFVAYIRHCEKRRNKTMASNSATEGEFFKRYVPEALYHKYDPLPGASVKEQRSLVKLPAGVLIVSLILGLLAVISVTLYLHQDKYIEKIDLSGEELAALNSERDVIIKDVDMTLPRLGDVIPLLKQRDVILLVDSSAQASQPVSDTDRPQPGQEDIIILESSNAKVRPTVSDTVRPVAEQRDVLPAGSPHKEVGKTVNNIHPAAAEQWIRHLASLKVPYTIHDRKKFGPRSLTDPGKSIVIVTPGSWDLSVLDALLDKGCSILLHGPPLLVSDRDNTMGWHGIGFERKGQSPASNMALVADQKLTLGFDAGLIIAAKPAFTGYRAVTNKPQAIAVAPHYINGEQVETRLYSPNLEKGRLVWMDFSPNSQDNPDVNVNNLNAIMAAVFRYLAGAVYSDISTWPEGRKFAAFLSMNLDTEVKGMYNLLERIENHSFPFTWFLLSDFVQEHRRLVRKLVKAGQVQCGGDFNDQFTDYPFSVQLTRAARCRKVLGEISGQEIEGFSPPRYNYDEATVNALINNEFTFHTTPWTDRGVPVVEVTGSTKKSIVSIPVTQNQRQALWKGSHFAAEEANSIIQADIDLARTQGSLYSMVIQDDYILDNSHLNAIVYIGKALQGDDCYFGDIRQLSEWWRFRQALRNQEPQDAQLSGLYKPVRLTVDKDGKLQREM